MLKNFKVIPIYLIAMIVSVILIVRKITIARDFEQTVLYHGLKYAKRVNNNATIIAIIASVTLVASLTFMILTIIEASKPHRRLETLLNSSDSCIATYSRGDVLAILQARERLCNAFKMHKDISVGVSVKELDNLITQVVENLKDKRQYQREIADELKRYNESATNYVDSVINFLESNDSNDDPTDKLNALAAAFKEAAK